MYQSRHFSLNILEGKLHLRFPTKSVDRGHGPLSQGGHPVRGCPLLAAGAAASEHPGQPPAAGQRSRGPGAHGPIVFPLGSQPPCFFLQCVPLPPTTRCTSSGKSRGFTRLPETPFCAALWRTPVRHYEMPSLERDEKSFLKEGLSSDRDGKATTSLL